MSPIRFRSYMRYSVIPAIFGFVAGMFVSMILFAIDLQGMHERWEDEWHHKNPPAVTHEEDHERTSD